MGRHRATGPNSRCVIHALPCERVVGYRTYPRGHDAVPEVQLRAATWFVSCGRDATRLRALGVATATRARSHCLGVMDALATRLVYRRIQNIWIVDRTTVDAFSHLVLSGHPGIEVIYPLMHKRMPLNRHSEQKGNRQPYFDAG